MSAKLHQKSQVNNPEDIIVCSKSYMNELREEIDEVKAKVDAGEQPVFDSVDALFEKLEEN